LIDLNIHTNAFGVLWFKKVMQLRRWVPVLMVASSLVLGQQPVMNTVQNAATMSGSPVPIIAPQMLVAIKGQGLAATSATADLPWPMQLAGTSVTFNGTPAALYYVSPSQINAVVPSAIQGSASATIVVKTAAGVSPPLTATVAASAIGIFTQDMSGCSQLSAYNIHSDGSVSLNTPQNSLDPISDYGLAIWLTGLGTFSDRIDGVPWQFNPSDNLVKSVGSIFSPSLVLGIPIIPNVSSLLEPMVVTYAGPAPGLSGVDQVNATFANAPPLGIPIHPPGRGLARHQGCNIPMYLTDNVTSASQLVSVSIHDGGGPCVDPSPIGMATIDWQKSFISDSGGASSSDAVVAMFLRGSGINFPEPVRDDSFHYSANVPPQPSVCLASYPATLDVGAIMLSGAGANPISLIAANSGGILRYSTSLPAGTINGGAYQVTGNGFSDTETIPPPITIMTNLKPGTKVPSALIVNWTGGNTQSVVTVQLLVRAAGSAAISFVALTSQLASKGSVSFPGFYCAPLNLSPECGSGPSPQQFPYPAGDVEVIVTQQRVVGTPAENAFPPFAIPGFSLGGEQTWSYVWDFHGLSNQ
jgi:uncharacterized protein (TIGR03437 family)